MRPAPPPSQSYLDFIRARVRAIRRAFPTDPPATEAGWQARLVKVREGLTRSFGRAPTADCDLAPDVLGTIERDGHAIERLTFQSRPGVRVTANLYRPDPVKGPCPAVLSVHGHWPWARIDPNVQARCIGLAKLGYVTLCVDAFGAGERAIDPQPGTYHGALDGASLWPTGVSLLGLQVYDNHRAVDYLVSRPEVDPKRLAITGASGGGNQSLYAGATDDRLAAVAPVCGIGTYESYLGTGCCVCEVNVGGLTYATTGDLLAMIAPRALLVVSATRDAIQFSEAEAAKSVAFARGRYLGLGVEAKIKHAAFDSGHGYNQAMRETVYGWFDRWLREKGDGGPVPEPPITTEDPQALRCYPDARSRPKTIVTVPEFALREGRARLSALPTAPDHPERWESNAVWIRSMLSELVGDPAAGSIAVSGAAPDVTIRAGTGLDLAGRVIRPGVADKPALTTLLLRHEGQARDDDPLVTALLATHRTVATVDLRATGRGKPETGAVHGLTDHNEAEWGLWIGRPLLGQWVQDALAWIDTLPRLGRVGAGLEVVGVGPFGLVALIAATLRPGRIANVGLIGPLVSFVGHDATPWANLPMGLIAPSLLETADVGHLAALVAPARLVIAGAVEPTGTPATPARLAGGFAFTRSVYTMLKAAETLVVIDSTDVAGFVRAFGG